jgi:hypothetical protein
MPRQVARLASVAEAERAAAAERDASAASDAPDPKTEAEQASDSSPMKALYTGDFLERIDRIALQDLAYHEMTRANALVDQVAMYRGGLKSLKHRLQLTEQRVEVAQVASLDYKKDAAEAGNLLKEARLLQGMMKKKLIDLRAENKRRDERVSQAENLLKDANAHLKTELENAKEEKKARELAEREVKTLRAIVKDQKKHAAEAATLVEAAQKEGEKFREGANAALLALRQEKSQLQEQKNKADNALKRANKQVQACAGELLLPIPLSAAVDLQLQEQRPAALAESECVICLTEAPTHAMVACGHVVYCQACAAAQETTDCPVCRKQFVPEEVRHVVQIYD